MLADDYTTICLQLSPMMSRCRQCRWQRREIDFDSRSALVHRSDRSRRWKIASFKFAQHILHLNICHNYSLSHRLPRAETAQDQVFTIRMNHICASWRQEWESKITQFEFMNKNLQCKWSLFSRLTNEFRIGFIEPRRYVSTFNWNTKNHNNIVVGCGRV